MLYSEMVEKAIEMLNDNDDLFIDMVNELDCYMGFADGFRAYSMWDLDDLFCDDKVSDFLKRIDMTSFNLNDEYFIDTIYGLQSCDDISTHYHDNVDTGELLDNIIQYYNHIYFNDSDFEELIDSIVNYSDDEEND